MGHAGTLDPFATGLLIVGVNEAVKFFPYIDNEPKVYEATLTLGKETDTLDNEGTVTRELPVPSFDLEMLNNKTKHLLGTREQESPKYSAKKIDGERSYDLARQGIEFTPKKSLITIHSLEFTQINPAIVFRVTCSGGTYVRVIGREIAEALGTLGHLTELRRLGSGPYAVEKACLCDGKLEFVSISDFLGHLPLCDLRPEEFIRIQKGQQIACPSSGSSFVRLQYQEEFVGVGLLENQLIQPKRLMSGS